MDPEIINEMTAWESVATCILVGGNPLQTVKTVGKYFRANYTAKRSIWIKHSVETCSSHPKLLIPSSLNRTLPHNETGKYNNKDSKTLSASKKICLFVGALGLQFMDAIYCVEKTVSIAKHLFTISPMIAQGTILLHFVPNPHTELQGCSLKPPCCNCSLNRTNKLHSLFGLSLLITRLST